MKRIHRHDRSLRAVGFDAVAKARGFCVSPRVLTTRR